MKYFGKEIEIKKVIKKYRSLEYIRCDVCGKKLSGKYYSVSISHNDWGNDSIDSLKFIDICHDCVGDYAKKYLDEATGTERIEIEPEFVSDEIYSNPYYDKNDDGLVENDKEE